MIRRIFHSVTPAGDQKRFFVKEWGVHKEFSIIQLQQAIDNASLSRNMGINRIFPISGSSDLYSKLVCQGIWDINRIFPISGSSDLYSKLVCQGKGTFEPHPTISIHIKRTISKINS